MDHMGPVALVFGLLGVSLWLLRGKGLIGLSLVGAKAAPEKRLRIVDRLSLTAQNAVYLVEADGGQWLIGSSPTGLTVQAIDPVAPESAPAKADAGAGAGAGATDEDDLPRQLQSAMRRFDEARRATAATRGLNGRYRTAAAYLE